MSNSRVQLFDVNITLTKQKRIELARQAKKGKNETKFWESCVEDVSAVHLTVNKIILDGKDKANDDHDKVLEQSLIILGILMDGPISLQIARRYSWDSLLLRVLSQLKRKYDVNADIISDPATQNFLKLLMVFLKKISFEEQNSDEFYMNCLALLSSKNPTVCILVGRMLENYFCDTLDVLLMTQQTCTSSIIARLKAHVNSHQEIIPMILVGLLQAFNNTLPVEIGVALKIYERIMEPFSYEGLCRYFHLIKKEMVGQLVEAEVFLKTILMVLAKWDDQLYSSRGLKDLVSEMTEVLRYSKYLLDLIVIISQTQSCKAKYEVLTIMVSYLSGDIKVDFIRNIVKDCLFQQNTVYAISAVNLIASCCKLCGSSPFVDIIVARMGSGQPSGLLIDYVLPKLQEDIATLTGVIETLTQNELDEFKLSTLLSVLKVCKSSGHFVKRFEELAVQALDSLNPDTRMKAFCLLTDSSKSSQNVSQVQFGYIVKFLTANIHETITIRQESLALIGKVLLRLKHFIYGLEKRKQIITKKNFRIMEDYKQQLLELDATLDEKYLMFAKLIEYAVNGFFPGATLQRSSCSVLLLKKLNDVHQAKIDATATCQIKPLLDYTKIQVDIVLNRSIFETVLQNRLALLEIVDFSSCDTDSLINPFLNLVNSCRAADVAICKSVARLLLAGSQQGKAIQLIPNYKSTAKDSESHFLLQLTEVLKRKIEAAERNLMVTCMKSPINVILASISEILPLISNPQKDFLIDLTHLCKQACRLTVEICANASPEGNLPEKFGSSENSNKVSQVILRHCFRTIEAATECLGMIASQNVKHGTAGYYDLHYDIGKLLCDLLVQIRHRGAFSTVHTVFDGFCTLLANSGDTLLEELLSNWLDEFLNQISDLKVSVTRRSAGLPVAILSIVTSSKCDNIKLKYLNKTMSACTTICDVEVSTPDLAFDLAQVHAMNVQRVLMSDASLSKLIRPYLAQAFERCINLFSSAIFPIRNCAAMLFSVLMDKSVGNFKNRNGTAIQVQVPAAEFFMKFPSLYDILLRELQTAVNTMQNMEVHPVLFPILCLLSKLKPSNTDCVHSSYTLAPFIELVSKCYSSSHWKVREVAANAFSFMVNAIDVTKCLFSILDRFDEKMTPNQIHGSLLQVSALFDKHDRCITDIGRIGNRLGNLLILPQVRKNVPALDILFSVIRAHFSDKRPITVLEPFSRVSFEILEDQRSLEGCITDSLVEESAAALTKHCFAISEGAKVLELLSSSQFRFKLNLLKSLSDIPEISLMDNALTLRPICVEILNDPASSADMVLQALKIARKIDIPVEAEVFERYMMTKILPYQIRTQFLTTCSLFATESKKFTSVTNIVLKYSDSSYPRDVRVAAANAVAQLAELMNRDQLLLSIERLLADDDFEVRNISIQILSKLVGWRFEKCEEVCKLKLDELMIDLGMSRTILENCLDLILVGDLVPWLENYDDTIIFDKTDTLGTSEHPKQLMKACHLLIAYLPNLEHNERKSICKSLEFKIQRNMPQLAKANNLQWETSSEEGFLAILRIVLSAKVLKAFGWPYDYLAEIQALDYHPWIKLHS